MWIYANPNPKKKHVSDCVIRAVCIALNQSWYQTSDEIYAVAKEECDISQSDAIWGRYLYEKGFEPFKLPSTCPRCITVDQFTKYYPTGTYIIGTGSHAVAIIDGNYYDTWDSGSEVPTFFWVISPVY